MATAQKARYRVGGMDCASCAAKIDKAVRRVPGVEDVSVSVAAGTMTVSYDVSCDTGAMEKKVSGLGYSLRLLEKPGSAPAEPAHDHDHDHANDQGKPHVHGPSCNHDHGPGGHDHKHDHGHDHGHHHGHDHGHSHSHGDHEGHVHGPGCSHDPDHGHGHGAAKAHDHGQDVAKGHVHGPSCGHDHGAAKKEPHVHGPSCNHDHGAGKHEHHDHDHGHSHSHAAGAHEGHGHVHEPMDGPWWASAKGRLTILAGLGLAAAYALAHFLPDYRSPLFIAAMLIGLVPIARRAIMAALYGTPFSIEMLMTIAAVGAVAIDAAEEAAAVVFLFLIGELLEGLAAGKARKSIQALTALVPKTALVEQDGKTREVSASSLGIGAVVLVRPGERMPADGIVISGEGAVDEAPVTGESTPVNKREKDEVFAGTINGESVLRIRVSAAAEDNTIARVVRMIEEAQEKKAPTERFIDRFSSYYTPAVVAVAALVAIAPPLALGASWSEWIYKALAILLIGCPCALVISTPAAIAASLSAGARRGLLMKGGSVLENLGKLTAIALDKTGTLTAGKPEVTDIVAFSHSAEDVLRLAAALEQGSSHPLARAVLSRAANDGVAVPAARNARAIGGKGVSGEVEGLSVVFGSSRLAEEQGSLTAEQSARIAALAGEGKTVSVVTVSGVPAGVIAMRDEPRPDAAAGLAALAKAGVRTIMLTGDNAATAAAIGRKLGIEVRAGLMPQDKQRVVGELKRQGFVVGKVGDGINDAPALAAADVGIAMGGGTDVALETADAAVLHGRVGDIAAMIELSKRTMRNIWQNITIALGLKAVFLVTTILGVTGLWPAIMADTGATVMVTANALRLLKTR